MRNVPWSPTIKQLWMEIKLWSNLSKLAHGKTISNKYIQRLAKITNIHQPWCLSNSTIDEFLKKTKDKYKKIKTNAIHLRTDFLDQLSLELAERNNTSFETERKKQVEERWL